MQERQQVIRKIKKTAHENGSGFLASIKQDRIRMVRGMVDTWFEW
jgi:hypothetical protein